jgi:adenosylcobinamide-GDP ribazoletransferase
LTATELIIALAGALLPFAMLSFYYLLALLPVIIARWYTGRYFKKWIGGYTGDCLGATQQDCELVF